MNPGGTKDVDARGSALYSPSQRSEQPSAGGDMTACSFSDGRARGWPSVWSPRTAAKLRPGAVVPGNVEDQEYCQILQLRGRGRPVL